MYAYSDFKQFYHYVMFNLREKGLILKEVSI